jgi:hypothetical protein
VPTSITLKILHDIIQVVRAVRLHLWDFTIGNGMAEGRQPGTEPRIAAGKVHLRDVLKPRKTVKLW